jgi:hypothetical protein
MGGKHKLTLSRVANLKKGAEKLTASQKWPKVEKENLPVCCSFWSLGYLLANLGLGHSYIWRAFYCHK